LELADKLSEILGSFEGLLSELVLITGAIFLIIVGLFTQSRNILQLLFVAIIILSLVFLQGPLGMYFFDQLESDTVSLFLKFLLGSTAILISFYRYEINYKSEFYFLLLSVLSGSFLMVSAHHFLVLYVAIELTSYGSYFLTGIKFSKKAIEGTFRYYLYGAVSSAVILYGISLYFGDTGTFFLTSTNSQMGELGVMLILVGLLFKTSVAPFHIWAPSAYQVAPTPVVGFFSVVPKLAGFGALYHLSKYTMASDLVNVLMVVAVISVIWGTLAAIRQTNVKRLLAYGAIANSGLILPLVMVDIQYLTNAFFFFATIYALMNIGIFYLVSLFEKENPDLKISDFAGMNTVYPAIGVSYLIILIALIGLPPTAGFTAKLILFSGVWEYFQHQRSIVWIVFFIVGILSSVISLYYYLRIPYYFFLKKGEAHSAGITQVQVLFATIFAAVMLILFIHPNILDNFVYPFE